MVKSKSRTQTKRSPDLLPDSFATLEDARDFWDVHDSADYEEYMKDIECQVDIQRHIYLISLDRELSRKIRSIAEKKGISAATLLNQWIQEKASQRLISLSSTPARLGPRRM